MARTKQTARRKPSRAPSTPTATTSRSQASKKKKVPQKPRAKSAVESDASEFDVEAILDKRERNNRTEYYIKWLNCPPSENSWEPAANIEHLITLVRKFERTHEQKLRQQHQAAISTNSVGRRTMTKSSPRKITDEMAEEESFRDMSRVFSFDESDEEQDDVKQPSPKRGRPPKKQQSKASPSKPLRVQSSLKFSPSPSPSSAIVSPKATPNKGKAASKSPSSKKGSKSPKTDSSSKEDTSTSIIEQGHPESFSLTHLKEAKIINGSSSSKTTILHGLIDEQDAIIELEKTVFNDDAVIKMVSDANSTHLNEDFINDKYRNYFLNTTDQAINKIKVKVIYPADSAAIAKYTKSKSILFNESPEVYKDVVEPYIETVLEQKDVNKWISNILDGKTEQKRVILHDKNKNNGFVLIPSLNWSGDENDLYLLAISNRSDIRSLRDLNATHLPLLKNIFNKSMQAIEKKYKNQDGQIRAYIHYHPTFYHFHVHFNLIQPDEYSTTDRDNLLSTVINNIELVDDYYKKAALSYPLSEESKLYSALKSAKKI